MAHVDIPPGTPPGTPGLMMYRQDTGGPLSQLAEVLLRDENSLSRSERELIAAYVSYLNDCYFCWQTHAQMSVQQDAGADLARIESLVDDFQTAPLKPKLRALLVIAGAATISGKSVTSELVAAAKDHGATDAEIHDTVLIAAAFCMYNRYCDGLAVVVPQDPTAYIGMAQHIIRGGYSMCAKGH